MKSLDSGEWSESCFMPRSGGDRSMITLRRSGKRHHIQRRQRDVWLTFYAMDRADPLADGFGMLEILNEDRFAPGAGTALEACHEAEIVTYVLEGALAHEDSTGGSGVIQAGEFHRRTSGPGLKRRETNASRVDHARVFHMGLRPSQADRASSHEQKRFSTAERRGVLRVVASPDGRSGSLRVDEDARVYSALLESGQHLVHELSPGHRAWVHVVRGEITLGDVVLTMGDGVGVTAERAVSLTAAATSTEILLLDLGP
jgi:hypothetical protein